MTGAADHFSGVSAGYAAFRPSYPRELFTFVGSIAPARRRAWDCAAGTGQATLDLAAVFEHVVATDLSHDQIRRGPSHPAVDRVAATAEDAPLKTGAMDAVIVAQALHWLDPARFHAEVRRVVAPGGVIVVWTYQSPDMDGDAGRILRRFMTEDVGPYWPPERRHVDAGYRTLPFPFERIGTPAFPLEYEWTKAQVAGYLRTMSATDRYLRAHRVDPVARIEDELREAWPDPEPRRIVWPLVILAGRVG